MNDSLIERAKRFPPPHWGVVVVPLELLPAYYKLHGVEPIPGGWKFHRDQGDHVLHVRKLAPDEKKPQ